MLSYLNWTARQGQLGKELTGTFRFSVTAFYSTDAKNQKKSNFKHQESVLALQSDSYA